MSFSVRMPVSRVLEDRQGEAVPLPGPGCRGGLASTKARRPIKGMLTAGAVYINRNVMIGANIGTKGGAGDETGGGTRCQMQGGAEGFRELREGTSIQAGRRCRAPERCPGELMPLPGHSCIGSRWGTAERRLV